MANWTKKEDGLPPAGVWVIGRKGQHRPFVFRVIHIKCDRYGGTACVDVDNNYRDPDRWTHIPIEP
jgi:hypothetical protein